MSTDAIVLLRDDHKEIRRLFREFSRANAGARATQQQLAGKIIDQFWLCAECPVCAG